MAVTRRLLLKHFPGATRRLQATVYSHAMNREWIREKLTEYRNLLEKYQASRMAGRPDADIPAELLRRESTIREILRRLGSGLTLIDPDVKSGDGSPFGLSLQGQAALIRALGILDDREDWAANLAADTPVLPAGQLHPWVWNAAQTLWDSEHYRLAVQAAATAINAHTQTKLSRRDVADDKLMQEAFSTNAPGPGRPRLRCPGDPADPTVQSRQRGALQYAVGCFYAIRNPATHQSGEWDQQVALEYLAALSVLARWIDDWTLDTTP
jgi:hypothetical protein